MDLRETGCDSMDWTEKAQNRVKWSASYRMYVYQLLKMAHCHRDTMEDMSYHCIDLHLKAVGIL